jgi:hypothetical protein
MRATAGTAFLRFKPTEAAMLSNGELREANCATELIGRVPVPLLLTFNEHAKHRLDAFQPFIELHEAPRFA